jgi:hypothetical protein
MKRIAVLCLPLLMAVAARPRMLVLRDEVHVSARPPGVLVVIAPVPVPPPTLKELGLPAKDGKKVMAAFDAGTALKLALADHHRSDTRIGKAREAWTKARADAITILAAAKRNAPADRTYGILLASSAAESDPVDAAMAKEALAAFDHCVATATGLLAATCGDLAGEELLAVDEKGDPLPRWRAALAQIPAEQLSKTELDDSLNDRLATADYDAGRLTDAIQEAEKVTAGMYRLSALITKARALGYLGDCRGVAQAIADARGLGQPAAEAKEVFDDLELQCVADPVSGLSKDDLKKLDAKAALADKDIASYAEDFALPSDLRGRVVRAVELCAKTRGGPRLPAKLVLELSGMVTAIVVKVEPADLASDLGACLAKRLAGSEVSKVSGTVTITR